MALRHRNADMVVKRSHPLYVTALAVADLDDACDEYEHRCTDPCCLVGKAYSRITESRYQEQADCASGDHLEHAGIHGAGCETETLESRSAHAEDAEHTIEESGSDEHLA